MCVIWMYSSPMIPVESSDTKNKKYYLTGSGRRLQPMSDVSTCMGTPKSQIKNKYCINICED